MLGLDLKHFAVIEFLYIDLISLSINRYVHGNLCLDIVVTAVLLLP